MSKDLLQIDDKAFDELMNGMHRPSWFEVAGYVAISCVLSTLATLWLVKEVCGA